MAIKYCFRNYTFTVLVCGTGKDMAIELYCKCIYRIAHITPHTNRNEIYVGINSSTLKLLKNLSRA